MQIEIKVEDVERAVTDAIVHSAIGDQIKLAIGKALSSYSFQKAVDDEITKIIAVIIRNELIDNEDLKARCRAQLQEQLTDQAILQLTSGLLEKIMFS